MGLGLEDTLTDVAAKNIIEASIIPRLRANDFSDGIMRGVDAIVEVLEAGPKNVGQRLGGTLGGAEPSRAKWETLPVRIGAFHEAFNHIAKRGATDLLAEPARCGRGACFYQLTDLDGSVASKVIVAAGPPENNASSIELQAPVTLAQNTLAGAIATAVEIANPELSATSRLHVVRSLFADMADPQMIRNGGAACVDLVPGHWITLGADGLRMYEGGD